MKIKILVLNIKELGGIERVAMNMYNMFKKDESFTDIEIISIEGNSQINGIRVLNGSNENIKLYHLAKSLPKDTILLSLYDRFSIKLSIIRKLFNFNFILYACQHADFFAHPSKTRLLRNITYKWIDKIIALTKTDAELYKLKFNNVYIIPNVLGFYPDNCKHISERTIDCAAAGRLVAIKQYDHFINFLDSIYKNNNTQSFKIFGTGEEIQNLELKISQTNLEPFDILVGKTENIYVELDNTKFFFVTSQRESFSMVILEAMACGCIVISYDCPTGPRELIENGHNGFLIELNNQKKLIDCYNELIKNPIKCAQVQNNARIFSRQFLEKNIIKKWKEVINEK